MSIKKRKELNYEGMKDLLLHWFRYYGKKIFTLEELDKYKQILDANPKGLFDLAVILYKNDLGSTPVLEAIRGENFDELKEMIEKSRELPLKVLEDYAEDFIKEVVITYNNPEPDIPLTDDELESQMKDLGIDPEKVAILTIDKNQSLNSEDVEKIIIDCMFREDEIINDAPTKEFTYVEGIENNYFFVQNV